jgi:hypothetical protein
VGVRAAPSAVLDVQSGSPRYGIGGGRVGNVDTPTSLLFADVQQSVTATAARQGVGVNVTGDTESAAEMQS